MQITEQWILSHAPGPAVAESGRALSEAGSFSALSRTEDAKTYWAECAGSAKNPYYVSVDWSLSDKEPAYSCSCPSRHFPCKHALGLMYELMAGKPFAVGHMPPYVMKARAKQAEEKAKAEARLQKARKYDAAVKEKKLLRQLEGLAKAEKMSDELLANGLASVSCLPAQSLERLARELGGRDLAGPRDAFERIALAEKRLRQDSAHAHRYYAEILRILVSLHAMIGRSRQFLEEQLSSGSYAMEDPLLYEALGGVWNPDELLEIGSYRKNARLVQLSFDVSRDEAKRACIERGFWLELTRGDVVHTRASRSVNAFKYGAGSDSCFELLEVPVLYERPGAPCPRVWWDSAVSMPLTAEEHASLRRFAAARVAEAVKAAAVRLEEPLLPEYVPALLRIGSIGLAGGVPVLDDGEGGRIALRDRPGDGAERASVRRLTALPEAPREGDALFGLIFYDEADRRFCLHPYSLVTENRIIRLQF